MPDSLDIRTLIFVVALVRFVQAVALVVFWRGHPGDRPARDWALGSVLCAVGTTVSALRDVIPLWVSVIIGNGLLLAGWMIFDCGIVSVAGAVPPRRLGVAVWVATIGTMIWFCVWDPDYVARVIAISLGVALYDGYAAGVCVWSPSGKPKSLLMTLAFCLLMLVLANLYRAYSAYGEHLTTLMAPGLRQAQLALCAIGFSIIVTILLVLLTSQKLQDQLDKQARIDPLTKAFNRRALEELADREWARSRRHGYPFSVLMVDIDHFKRINDTYGHMAGDTALAAVSAIAHPVLRPEDIWCRYGGEEFIVLLPQSTGDHAMVIAERLRSAIETQSPGFSADRFVVTVSIGVAETSATQGTWRDAIGAADRALYQAKREGRNRIVLAPRFSAVDTTSDPAIDTTSDQAVVSAIVTHRRSPA